MAETVVDDQMVQKYDLFVFDNEFEWSPEKEVSHVKDQASGTRGWHKSKCNVLTDGGNKFLKLNIRDCNLLAATGQKRFVRSIGESSALKNLITLRNYMMWGQ